MSTGGNKTIRFINTGLGEGRNERIILDRGQIIPPVDLPNAPNDCSNDPINTICGFEAGKLITTGSNNSFFGVRTGQVYTTGQNNSLFGHESGRLIFGGVGNTLLGSNVATELKTGSNNVVLGNSSSSAWSGVESSNIIIFNDGQSGDSATIKIGKLNLHESKTFIQGIHDTTQSGIDIKNVTVDENGHMGTDSSGGAGDVSSNVATSVVGQVALFDDTSGKLITTGQISMDGGGNMSSINTIDMMATATADDFVAQIIDVDAAGFAPTIALGIALETGAISTGDVVTSSLNQIDQALSTGGKAFGNTVFTTTSGSATTHALGTGVNVSPIYQNSGTATDADVLLNVAANVTVALSIGGSGDITIFANNNDTFTIQDAAKYAEIGFLLDIDASNGGISPTFEFSSGSGPTTYTFFSPQDSTNGMRNSGSISYDLLDIPTWIVGDSGNFEIRITRTRMTINTLPRCDLIQIASTNVFEWDLDGKINIKTLTLDDTGSGFSQSIVAGSLVGNIPWTLPTLQGASNTTLTNNGSGVLSWEGMSQNSTGVIAGGFLTINVDTTKFDVSDGNGFIFNTTTLVSTSVSWSGLTAQSTTYVGDETFISINSGGTVSFSTTLPTNTEIRDDIYLGQIVHLDQINIITTLDEQMTLLSNSNQIRDFMEAIGHLKINGNILSSNSLLTIAKTAGEILEFGGNFANDINNPHLPISGTLDTNVSDVFAYRWQDGTIRLSLTSIVPGEFDDGNGESMPGSVMSNQWSVQRVFTFSIGAMVIQQAQFVYGNEDDAIANIETEGFIIENGLVVSGILIGFIVLKGDTSDLSSADARFLEAGKFGGASVGTASGVNGPGSSTDNAIARWNTTTGTIIQNSSVIIDDSNNVTGIVDLRATGDVDFNTVTSFNLLSTGVLSLDGSGDITVDSFTGTIVLNAVASTSSSAVRLRAQAGGVDIDADNDIFIDAANGRIDIRSVADTGGSSVQLQASAGSVDIDAALNVTIDATNNIFLDTATGRIDLQAVASTAVGAIQLEATAGGINIDANNNITIDSAVGLINLTSVASTSAAAIKLDVSAGGIQIVTALDLDINATSDVFIDTTNGRIDLNATGSTSSNAIQLNAVAGGVDIDSALQTNITSSQAAATAIILNASNASGGIEIQQQGTDRFKTDATGLSFFNKVTVAKPTVTGERDANPALADLLTDLASLGLLTDSTTAGSAPSGGGLPTGYVTGLFISDNSVSLKAISAGSCRDDSDTEDLIFSGENVNIAVSGVGGLDTGSEASNTWYAIFIIGGGGNSEAPLLSLSATSPTLPGTYTLQRRIGWVRNDGSSNFLEYGITGNIDRFYLWREVLTEIRILNNGSATSFTNVDLSSLVPSTSTLVYLNVNHNGAINDSVQIRFDGTPASGQSALQVFSGANGDGNAIFHVECSTSQIIEYNNSAGSNATDVIVLGFTDSI